MARHAASRPRRADRARIGGRPRRVLVELEQPGTRPDRRAADRAHPGHHRCRLRPERHRRDRHPAPRSGGRRAGDHDRRHRSRPLPGRPPRHALSCSTSSGRPTSRSAAAARTGGPDAHPFPDDWRARRRCRLRLRHPADGRDRACRSTPSSVIAETVDASPSAPTIVTLGPLTNLEDAFAADETLADRVAAVHAMLGTVDAPGNVFVDGLDAEDPLEWNAYADPSAVDGGVRTRTCRSRSCRSMPPTTSRSRPTSPTA